MCETKDKFHIMPLLSSTMMNKNPVNMQEPFREKNIIFKAMQFYILGYEWPPSLTFQFMDSINKLYFTQ